MTDADTTITELILKAAEKAREETSNEPEPGLTKPVSWPVQCTVGPGLEGAIACESKVSYVNGTKGCLIYRGYDIFDLAAYSTFEEVSYLLLHGNLPTPGQLERYKKTLAEYRHLPATKRLLMGFPVEEMNSMAALRLGVNLMRQKQTYRDWEEVGPEFPEALSADEDSIPMETGPKGSKKATYEFRRKLYRRPKGVDSSLSGAEGLTSCHHLIAGMPSIAAAVARLREGHLPIEPDPELGHAANFIYMMTGRRPTPVEERVMDVALILHADHGINASTFAALVVASTLSDIYFSVGAGIAALNGPLHGGANEEVLRCLEEIGDPSGVERWFKSARRKKQKVMGFGHRVYKAYDPRARILKPLAFHLAGHRPDARRLCATAGELERRVVAALGEEKGVFPNVDFFSGLVYRALGIPPSMFTPIFAVSRVAGWTARLLEYLRKNRIFRPRSVYTGGFGREYVPLEERK